jgi:adenosylcobyric acid synthase
MTAKKALAILGTGSDVGKSIVAAAICRSLADRGIRVAPFKAQNMSNNSGVTPEGLEMGRAQIVQAEAARIPPHVDMNPVLLKPTTDSACQVVLNGRAYENSSAADYHSNNDHYFEAACRAYDRLDTDYDMIVLEGAGSCAEVNLMSSDFVNFRMAQYADADVILVADIHRGGVFAQIVGTMSCLPEKYKKRVKGFIINRFRGDISLFREGIEWIESKTGRPVFGVLPWYSHFRIDAEDSVEIESCPPALSIQKDKPSIAVIRLSHISNFTDFHALSAIDNLQLLFVDSPVDLAGFDAVIIPGSKNTSGDIKWLNSTGWTQKLKRYAEGNGHILGICGGYQILGSSVDDPEGLEGTPGVTQGLDLLPVKTVLMAPKVTTISNFSWYDAGGKGYEIHMGHTERTGGYPLFKVHARNGETCNCFDGCVSETHRIMGTYMHGMFDSAQITQKWLDAIGLSDRLALDKMDLPPKDHNYTRLKEHFEQFINMKAIFKTISTEKTIAQTS